MNKFTTLALLAAVAIGATAIKANAADLETFAGFCGSAQPLGSEEFTYFRLDRPDIGALYDKAMQDSYDVAHKHDGGYAGMTSDDYAKWTAEMESQNAVWRVAMNKVNSADQEWRCQKRKEFIAKATAKAEADRARIEAEAKVKIDAERAQIEADAKAKIRADIEANLRASSETEAKAKAEADAKADIDAASKAKDKALIDAKAAEAAKLEAAAVARNEDQRWDAKAKADAADAEQARITAETKAAEEDNVRLAKERANASALAEKAYIAANKAADAKVPDYQLEGTCSHLPEMQRLIKSGGDNVEAGKANVRKHADRLRCFG